MQFRARGGTPPVPVRIPASDPAAEAALEQALQSAGGGFTCRADPGNSAWGQREKTFHIVGVSSGAPPLATIRVRSSREPVTVTLPDGRHAFVLTQSGHHVNGMHILNATLAGRQVKTTPNGSIMALCNGQVGASIAIKGPQNEGILLSDGVKTSWIFPFLVLTACLGFVCLQCMVKLKFLLTKDGEQVGQIDQSEDGWIISGKDPVVLKEAILLMAYAEFYNDNLGDGASTGGPM